MFKMNFESALAFIIVGVVASIAGCTAIGIKSGDEPQKARINCNCKK